MTNECPSIEELGALEALPDDDERRRHLDDCPRCRARLATYRDFMNGGDADDVEVSDEVIERLGDGLDREILGDRRPAAARTGIVGWRSPVVRTALAAAASVLLFVAVDGLRPEGGPEPILLRSDGGDAAPGDLLAPHSTPLGDGGLELSWRAVDGVDAYRVEILDSTFAVVADLPAADGVSLSMPRARLEDLLPGEGTYVWVVVAMAGGDETARSAPTAFTLGRGR